MSGVTAAQSIEASVNQRWSLLPSLTSLVTADRLTTGNRRFDDELLPVATLSVEGERQEWSTSPVPLTITSLRIQVWLRDHADGAALRAAVKAAFDNTSWVSAGRKVILSRLTNTFAVAEEGDVWQFSFDLELSHYL